VGQWLLCKLMQRYVSAKAITVDFYCFFFITIVGFDNEEPLGFLGGLTGFLGRVDFFCSFLNEEIPDFPADFFAQID